MPAPREARWLVERCSGLDAASWAGACDEVAPAVAAATCRAMVGRRLAGEPLQYVLGRWAFRSLELFVDRRVLIPRPETEQVVETAERELRSLRSCEVAGGEGPVVVDLGTGSGAIALSVAAEEPGVAIWATDASEEALSVARANLAGLGGWAATRVRLALGDWYGALPEELLGRVSMVVSNPPYVSEAEMASLPGEVAGWEPLRALVSGPTGLEAVEAVVSGAGRWLRRPGAVVVEIAPHQERAARRIAREAGFAEVNVEPDLAGRPRALVARI